MIENVGTALQTSATTGNGQTLVLPEPRLVTFKVQGNGPVSAGAVTLECCLQNTPVPPSSWSGGAMVWTPLTTIAVPANATTDYFAGIVWGALRARISTEEPLRSWPFGPRSKRAGAAAPREF